MALTSGTRLGRYDILAAIGKGGMGEVWRARDTKLDREVAIKTLPEKFAQDADRLARFEREAKLVALRSPEGPTRTACRSTPRAQGPHGSASRLRELR